MGDSVNVQSDIDVMWSNDRLLSPRKTLVPQFLCVYKGHIRQNPYEYLLITSVLRKIGDYDPLKATPDSTHAIQLSYTWHNKKKEKIQTILYSEHFNAGYWKIKEFKTDRDIWRGENIYREKLKEIDDCAKRVSRFFVNQLNLAPPEYLIKRKGVEVFWTKVLEEGLFECPKIMELNDKYKTLYSQGDRVFYD